MRIANEAIKKIDESLDCKNLLAYELRKSQYRIQVVINKNEEDSILTTATALSVIRKTTGLTDEQILTQEPAQA